MNAMAANRERAGYTQMEVAERIGVDRSAIAKWETGACMPRLTNLFKLAALYGCTVDELFEWVEQEKDDLMRTNQ